ncbi:hypothetical protein [Erythrobacter sp.]|jgi:hypothetical protein|uniref:hypothetical protein n=1 Tax=Erythrobacter sp. TaxID=1042 RepID=UPI002EC03A3D|nr:hypothetical protein [Erythrobacter sp.]
MASHEDKRAASRSQQVAASDQIYSLKFDTGGDSPLPDIDFYADNAYQALVIAHREGGGRSAGLWRDGKKLCTISELAGSFWEIRPCDGAGSDAVALAAPKRNGSAL